MSFVSQFAHYLEASHRLGNPFYVLLRRTVGKAHEYMAIEDRESGVRCRCTIGSYHMFGETWYLQAYDVPRVPIRQGDAVLDIDANQGFFTCYAAHRGARVYAFEPNPESYETLLSNVERNGFADRVEAKPWAIADK